MERNTCFLIAPIGPPGSEVRRRSDLVFAYIVEPAVTEVGYALLRAALCVNVTETPTSQ